MTERFYPMKKEWSMRAAGRQRSPWSSDPIYFISQGEQHKNTC